MLKPIKQLRVVDLIYEQLRDLIFRGELEPGDRLMPEREMADALKVSRTAVREAIQKLIESNIVETKRGSGTFVVGPESKNRVSSLLQLLKGQEFTVQEFLEVRMALECNGAALAANRATEEDIRLLEENIRLMKQEVLQGPENRSLYQDLSFHMNISYATRNMMQIHLMKSFYDFMLSGINKILPKLIREPGVDPCVLKQHIKIMEAIKSGNSDMAQEAMKDHINTLMETYSNLTEK